MKNLIEYYYGLNIENLRTYGEEYLFNSNKKLYLFYNIKNTDNVENMLNVLKMYKNRYFHTPILNKERKIITYDGEGYRILFLINILHNKTIDYKDILLFTKNNFIYFSDSIFIWEKMWREKVDFLENYIEKKDNINYLFKPLCYYYIGLAENSIKYLKKIHVLKTFNSCICHKRIHYNDTLIELYNPINFIIDNQCRDICEYLKSVCDSTIKVDFYQIVQSLNFSIYEIQLMIARLLFPSYFFDKLDLYNNEKMSTTDILNLYNYTTNYEVFLSEIIKIIKKNRNIYIPNIKWLNG